MMMDLKRWLVSICTAATTLGGCDLGDNGGGANDGQQTPGNMDDGVDLSRGEIAVSPKGTSFLARVGDALIHGDVDGSWRELPKLGDPDQLVFSPQRSVVYVATTDPPRLRAHDLARDEALWSTDIDEETGFFGASGRTWLHVTADDRYVIAVGFDDITVFDTHAGGRLGHWRTADEIVDVDVAPDGSELYVAHDERREDGQQWTPLSIFRLPDLYSDQTIWLPNCADEVVLGSKGHYAFMAPTTCHEDPVSVIDLERGEFVRNLPGFGPVALAADGELAVAFMDLDNLDESLFVDSDPRPEGDRRYHLMLIDTKTLEFTTVELGDSLPRYAPTPDGKLLLIDANAWYDDERVRIFDLQTGELHPVVGPDVRLHNFVLTQDATRAFLVDDGAYELSIGERILRSLPLSIIPTNINITADDRWLLLQDSLGPVHVYDVNAGRVRAVVGGDEGR